MSDMIDTTAWSGLLFGLYALFAGIGALRRPKLWQSVIEEVSKSPALQLIGGLLELVVGAIIYLANPWLPSDLLACVIKFVGGCMVIEALAIAGFCDIYSNFWLRNMTHMHRGWAIFAVVLGLLIALPSMLRFS